MGKDLLEWTKALQVNRLNDRGRATLPYTPRVFSCIMSCRATTQNNTRQLYCTVLRKDRNIGLLGHAMISVTITASSLKERTLLETNGLHRTVDNCTTFIEQSDVYAVKSCIQRCNMEVLCLCTINRLGKYVQRIGMSQRVCCKTVFLLKK